MTPEQRIAARERERKRGRSRRAALRCLMQELPKLPDDGGDLAGMVSGGIADDVGLARRGGRLRSVRR